MENWRRTHGSLPRSLDVLRDSDHGESGFSIRFNDERKVIDAWGNPVVYKIDGDEFELVSYGEDGEPGGEWFNSDLSNRESFPLICIPFCVPIMLWAMRITGAPRHDLPPTPSEILIPLLIWAVAFELVFPNVGPIVGYTFADPNDILCYTVGDCLAAIVWRRWHTDQSSLPQQTSGHPEPCESLSPQTK